MPPRPTKASPALQKGLWLPSPGGDAANGTKGPNDEAGIYLLVSLLENKDTDESNGGWIRGE